MRDSMIECLNKSKNYLQGVSCVGLSASWVLREIPHCFLVWWHIMLPYTLRGIMELLEEGDNKKVIQ